MATGTATDRAYARREARVAEAIHHGEMEGLHITPATRADAEEYVASAIGSQELLERVHRRYGNLRAAGD